MPLAVKMPALCWIWHAAMDESLGEGFLAKIRGNVGRNKAVLKGSVFSPFL